MRPSPPLSSAPYFPHAEETAARRFSPASFISTGLLAIILVAGPLVLGSVQPWIELPILGCVTLLLLLQGSRLATRAPIGSLRQIDAIDLSVVLFVIYAIVRWLTSIAEFYSRFEVLSVVSYAAVFIFCRYGITRRTYGLWLVVLLAVLGAGETVFGYLLRQHSNVGDPQSLWFPFGTSEQMHLVWAPRWVGTYGCPNHYACLLVMATGAALALGCFSRFAWPLRIIFFYAAAVILVGILYSQSRGSWLSLVGSVVALTIFGLRYAALRWWIPAVAGVIFAAILAGIFVSSPLAQRRADEMIGTVEGGALNKYLRVQLTIDALEIAHDHPLFGTGPATFDFVDPHYASDSLRVRAVFTHNDYLNCLDNYGIVGFALAMFFVYAVTLALFSRIGSGTVWPDRVLVATASAAWCALLVHSLLDFNMHIPANARILFALTGMALRRGPTEDAPHHWSTISLTRLGPWLGWGLCVFGLLYGAEIVRTALTDFPYEQAYADSEIAPTAQSLGRVQKSLELGPGNVQALILLGDLHRIRASRAEKTAERMSEGQQAIDAYEKALKGNPLDDTIKARMGVTYDLMERYSEAYLSLQSAITAQPHDGQFWMALGNHFMKSGMLEKAEQAYLTAGRCPHGGGGAYQAAARVRAVLNVENVPPAVPGTNPLQPREEPEPPTTP
jgi:tetratricopeptide (TPR) repeat protein